MGVIGDLLAVKEAEHGGETAFDRLDFQTSWGIARLIELHSEPGRRPYAIAFEFHDDIAEVDDPASPSFLRLYQLKTKKSGNWTLAAIARPERNPKGAPKPSFAGRMHANLGKFGRLAEKAVFVSNRPLSEAKGAAGEFALTGAELKQLTSFLTALKAEIATFSEADDLPRLRFLDCGLHLDTYDRTVIGQIALFLANEIGGDVDAKRFYLTLGFECRARSKRLADLSSIEDLVASKFVTRDDVEADLERIRVARLRRPVWEDVGRQLSQSHAVERELRDAWREYELIRIARATPATRKLIDGMRDRINPIIDPAASLMEGAVAAAAVIRADLEAILGPRKPNFAIAAALYEYFA